VGDHRRRITAVTLGAAVAVGAALGLAVPAQAHDYIASSTPVDGETLTALPAEFSVTASATLLDLAGDGSGFGIQVTDAAGRFYGDGCVSIVDTTVSTPAALGEAGDYELVWQFVSSDGHPTSGTIAFAWAPPAGAVASPGSAGAPVCGVDAEETPEPDMTTQATPEGEPTSEAPAGASAGDSDDSHSTLLWIGGAGVAVVLAIGATLLLVRPKKK
jgi:methionine-rich copper-binding protein CopC